MLELQDRFLAHADRAPVIVLQAIEAGKDSTIKHVMSRLNPEGVDVSSFKSRAAAERAHDYLLRHQRALPELGRIAVFNRSHYENVLITRVHPETLWPRTAALDAESIWHRRYRDINDWERYFTDNGTVVVKLFPNVSKDEQALGHLSTSAVLLETRGPSTRNTRGSTPLPKSSWRKRRRRCSAGTGRRHSKTRRANDGMPSRLGRPIHGYGLMGRPHREENGRWPKQSI
ncbi:hypothetical protein [Gordonia rhizosphera]|uniref:Polyphosphate kinase-2-related domain-containing protein n=1 Tax=Gordonia rhizosphera NBRC 16068 TaxID=1108045 RepID=K6W669_9ACTN|nr:hypothetical protein [Gordonia rhizosphera]GAB89196.1 hypothetical protein GORHZ_053_00490 [Gordonia rhizosphera NBRC 16068]